MRRFLDRFRFRRWGKWIIAGGVAMAAIGAISVEATSRSSFCNSCHIMEPYYASWKTSSHGDVECFECHIAPGVQNLVDAKLNGLGQVVDDVLNRTSHKPSASVSELSCTRSGCHSVETLSNHGIDNGRFKFRHDKHLGAKHLGVEITCGTCHSHVRGDTHFEVNTTVCITCHLVARDKGQPVAYSTDEGQTFLFAARSGAAVVAGADPAHEPGSAANGGKVPPANCTACHEPPEGEVEFKGLRFDHAEFLAYGTDCESCHQGVTATPPAIDDGRCLECHSFGLERSLGSREMHRVHTLGRHKIECSSCHGAVRHGPQARTASMEHFDCGRCHMNQHEIQRDTYFHMGESPHSPDGPAPVSPMFLAHADCTACHTHPRPAGSQPGTGATVLVATVDSCDGCHQDGFGKMMIPLWQGSTHELFDQVVRELEAARAAGIDAAIAADVQRLLDLVRADGSWGVHNPRYTQQLLEQARAKLTPTPEAEDENR